MGKDDDKSKKQEESTDKSDGGASQEKKQQHQQQQQQQQQQNAAPDSSGLQQLEHDLISKTQSGGNRGASKPGAVSVSSSPSSLAITRKEEARGGLSHLESDVIAKTQGGGNRGTSRPGAVSVPASNGSGSGSGAEGGSALSQLERDVMAKTQGSRGASGVSRPGAVSVPASSDSDTVVSGKSSRSSGGISNGGEAALSQVERDMLAKQQGSGVRSIQPGAVSANPSSSSTSSGFSQLERDVISKTQRGGNRGASRPGAVSVSTASPSATKGMGSTGTGEGSSALSQLERDVAAKTQGPRATPASQPGAVSVSSSGSSSAPTALSRLEQDTLAKTQGGSANRADRPGAVSVSHTSGASASSKPGATPGGGSNNTPTALSRLEQDTLVKTQGGSANRADRPGAVSVSHTSGASTSSKPGATPGGGSNTTPTALSRLEQDTLAKTQGGSANRADRPGAVSIPSTSDVSTSSKPGATPGGGSSSTSSSLLQLEHDVVAKTQGGSVDRASRPGVVAVAAGDSSSDRIAAKAGLAPNNAAASSGLSQLEQDVISKSQGGVQRASAPGITVVNKSAPAPVAGLTQLEQDVVSKTQGGSMERAAKPGAMSVAKGASSGLESLEQAIINKTQQGNVTSAPAPAPASLNQMERDVMTKRAVASGAALPSSPGPSCLSQLEQDVVAKTQGRAATQQAAAAAPGAVMLTGNGSLEQLERDIIAKASGRGAQADPPAGAAGLASMQDMETHLIGTTRSAPDYSAAGANVPTYHQEPPTYHQEPEYFEERVDHGPYRPNEPAPFASDAPQIADVAPVAHVAQDPEAPIYNDSGYGEAEGIQAFVADTVVDATGVAVILSEEEEERMERRRNKKLIIRVGIVGSIIILAIVILASVFAGGSPAPPPTDAPSEAPTMAPTFAPTTSSFSVFADKFAPFSGTDVFSDRSTPQYKALQWITRDDDLSQGLTDQRLVQRYILAVFYYAVGGNNWTKCNLGDTKCVDDDLNSWLSETNECTWLGLSCDDQDLIDEINFGMCISVDLSVNITIGMGISLFFHTALAEETWEDEIPLTGSLPSELKFLNELRIFTTPDQKLKGSIRDAFGGLTKLQTFSVVNNMFTGTLPSTIGADLPGLISFDISNNNFNGTIPTGFTQLANIRSLRLGGNNLSGAIPSQLGLTTSLRK